MGDSRKIPKHVAIIPDGNRRWAKKNGEDALEGHLQGRERVLEIVERAKEIGITDMTVWGFSTENWNRSAKEVNYLMKEIFLGGYKKYMDRFNELEVRFRHLGRKDRLPKEVMKVLNDLEENTKSFVGHTVSFALDYGGRDEIVRAVKKIVDMGVDEEEIDEKLLSENLDTAGIEPPDMVIRTSGEQRLSGFLPWQGVYAELFFVDIPFPEFTADVFEKTVREFGNRQRRFGGDSV